MSKIEDRVAEEIQRRQLKPRPLVYFLGKRSVFWALAAISVFLGAIAAATSIFLISDYLRTGGRELDEIPFDDVAVYAPVAWLALLLVFGFCAQLSFKATPRGYRFRPWHVIAAAVTASIVLGSLLYLINAGGAAHHFLVSHWRSYAQATTIPYEKWSKPKQGFLGGEVLAENGKTLLIRDFHGKDWTIDISDALVMLHQSATQEGDIAIRGEVTGEHDFKARSIAPFD